MILVIECFQRTKTKEWFLASFNSRQPETGKDIIKSDQWNYLSVSPGAPQRNSSFFDMAGFPEVQLQRRQKALVPSRKTGCVCSPASPAAMSG
jgi:hypothetical protein